MGSTISALGSTLLIAAPFACGFSAASQPDGMPPGGGAGTHSMAQKVAIPGYFYQPVSSYRQLAQNVPAVGIVVANINSGPGADFSEDWASATRAVHRARVSVLGYVNTGYIGTSGHTTRPPSPSSELRAWRSQVRNDIDTWYRFYGSSLGGIFLDQAPKDCGPVKGDHSWVNFYIETYRYVKRRHPGAVVVANPGNVPNACYLQAADTLVTFEGDYSTYVDPVGGFDEPGWERTVDPRRIWHLVYDTTQAQIADAVARAKERNAGYVYVTSLPGPNPWHALPADAYWDHELGRVAGSTDTTPPTSPRNLQATVYFNKVSLTWQSSTDNVAVVGYDVYEGSSPVSSVHHNSATLTGLRTATRHTYTVRARDAAGNVSPPSSAVRITTPSADDTAPTAPSNLEAVGAFSRSVQLRWTASSDPDDTVVSYDVYQGDSLAATVPTGGASCPTCAIVRGLEPNTRYSFTVRARDEAGNASPASETATVITQPPAGAPIVNVSVCMDSRSAEFAATYTEAYEYHRVLIDSDNSPSTGYHLHVSTPLGADYPFGADYMIESSKLDTLPYRYRGPQPPRQTAWSWDRDPNVTPVVSAVNGTYTWQIPISALGGSGTRQVVIGAGVSDGSTADVYTAPITVTPNGSCS